MPEKLVLLIYRWGQSQPELARATQNYPEPEPTIVSQEQIKIKEALTDMK